MRPEQLEIFNDCRPVLVSLARRILGSESEAEDMVQETYLRWQKTDLQQVKSPKAFLTTTITRLCLNQLKLARVRLEAPDARSLVEEEFAANAPRPDQLAELADALTQAFTKMLANLSPTETAVFLLREAFDFDYSEIAPIVERSEENCRQILKRARERMLRDQARYKTHPEQNQKMVQVFREAVTTGELESLLDALSEDAVLVQDAGDVSKPAPPPLFGPGLKEELRLALQRMLSGGSRLLSSGQPSGHHLLLSESGGQALRAVLFAVQQERIKSIHVVTCPAVLRNLRVLVACQFSNVQVINENKQNQ